MKEASLHNCIPGFNDSVESFAKVIHCFAGRFRTHLVVFVAMTSRKIHQTQVPENI